MQKSPWKSWSQISQKKCLKWILDFLRPRYMHQIRMVLLNLQTEPSSTKHVCYWKNTITISLAGRDPTSLRNIAEADRNTESWYGNTIWTSVRQGTKNNHIRILGCAAYSLIYMANRKSKSKHSETLKMYAVLRNGLLRMYIPWRRALVNTKHVSFEETWLLSRIEDNISH